MVLAYLWGFLGTFSQEGPHAALQTLHVHLLRRLCVVDLNFIHLQRANVSAQNCIDKHWEAFGSPGEVQPPARPPRRWRLPLEVEVGSRLKAACRLSLPRHHHCLRPEQGEDRRGDGNVVSSSHRNVQQLRLGLHLLVPPDTC